MDISCDAATELDLQQDPEFEYGLLPLEGEVAIGEEIFRTDEFAYLGRGQDRLRLRLACGSKVLLLGGRPFDQPVLMWWNFVGYTKAAIAEAQRQWESGDPRFGPVGGSTAPRMAPPPLPWHDY